MSEVARRIDEVIRTGLAPALKAQGYKKAARTFRRREPGHTLVVNVQGSSWNSDADGSFTLNLGVYFPTVVPFLDWMRAVERPTEPDCVVRQRIGFVMPRFPPQQIDYRRGRGGMLSHRILIPGLSRHHRPRPGRTTRCPRRCRCRRRR